jgi:type IV pilus assembly protein PilV
MLLDGKRHSVRGGFSLLEVLIAVVVVGIGFLAAASMQGTSISHNTKSGYLTSATYLAQDKIEGLRYVPFQFVTTDGSPEVQIDEVGDAGGIFTRSWAVAMDTPGTLMRTVTVTVTWRVRGIIHSLTMTSVIAA